eukprot:COSAG06_NODE_56_length_27627_cov_106.527136_25_plen_51_part_00
MGEFTKTGSGQAQHQNKSQFAINDIIYYNVSRQAFDSQLHREGLRSVFLR